MAILRVGIIGCGGIANTHARVLSELTDRVTIAAMCDIDEERALALNAKFVQGSAAIYTDFSQMMRDVPLDVVYICIPPFAHSNEVELAAERGIHVFIEKPIALSMDLANQMVAAVEKHKIKSQVGFMGRFGEAVEAVKALVDSGEAGPVGMMVGKYACNSLHAPWWRDKTKSGGQMVEQITHTFDIVRYFLGTATSVFSRMDNVFHQAVEGYTAEDISATVITFASGAIAAVTGTNGAIPGKWLSSYELVAQNITVPFVDSNEATIIRTDRSPVEEERVSGSRDVMTAEAVDLLDSIENDGETRVPMIEGAKSLELVLAASKSAETGQIVQLG